MTGERSPELDAFVEEAKDVELLTAFERAGFSLALLKAGARATSEHYGPCPACGGTDRFSISPAKQMFNCRGHGGGGVLSMVMHITGAAYLNACEIALGRDRPDLSEIGRVEREKSRKAAEAESARLRAEADAKTAKREAEAEAYRAQELRRCLEDWRQAKAFTGSEAERYLDQRAAARLGLDASYLRCHPDLIFWSKDENGKNAALHRGPALLALFVVPEGSRSSGRFRPIGLHRTWIDLRNGPKFRPDIHDPKTGELLKTKKMRGSKAGGLIPLIGRLSRAVRLVAGEGIETTIGFALRDGMRADTFYCAAGDLGNLCGKADPNCPRIRVDGAVKRDSLGRGRPVFVPGEEPNMDSECLPVPDWITELVLLGDGDSEPVGTLAALRRGVKRHKREGRLCIGMMAPRGQDWADVARGTEAARPEAPDPKARGGLLEIAVELAAEAFGTDVATVLSRRRWKRLVAARAVAIGMIRHGGFAINGRVPSTPWIGRCFGLHHTSVLHAVQCYRDWCQDLGLPVEPILGPLDMRGRARALAAHPTLKDLPAVEADALERPIRAEMTKPAFRASWQDASVGAAA